MVRNYIITLTIYQSDHTYMQSKKVTFSNSNGDSLSARIMLPPSGKPQVFAIFAHCFTCSKDLKASVNIARALVSHDIGVMRFDFTGLGESDGDFSDTSFSTNRSDLLAAAAYLEENWTAPSVLIGHSLGGAAVLMVASEISSVKAVATIGAPADPEHVTNLLENKLDEIEDEGQAMVNIGGRPFPVSRTFLEDLKKHDPATSIRNMGVSLLILHSPQDMVVEIENARKIYEAAMHPKSFISLDGADHLLSNEADSHYAGDVIAAWSDRYLNVDREPSLPESDREVVTSTGTGFTTEVNAGRHNLIVDEPESVGGSDLGPTPYDYLITSLGACTGMTLQMYAERKKWPLKEVRVHLMHDKVHEADCEKCEDKEARIDRISREIEISGDLSDEQINRLMEIADKCPVHKTLTGEIRVETKIRD